MKENFMFVQVHLGVTLGIYDIQGRESRNGEESCAHGRFSDWYYSRSL